MKDYLIYKENGIEVIYRRNSLIKYDVHIHCYTINVGFVLDGTMKIEKNREVLLLSKGSGFGVEPFCPHKMESEGKCSLLMISCMVDWVNLEKRARLLAEIRKVLASFDINLDINYYTDFITEVFQQYLDRCLIADFGMQNCYVNLLDQAKDLDEMAEVFHYSKFYFIKKFKSVIGITPHRLKTIRKIRKSQEMFFEGKTVNEVMHNLYYYDQSHFIKVFKEMVGITPTDYLNAIQVRY